MNPEVRALITDQRLAAYRRRMLETNSTPIICIGVGHGPQRGQLVVCTLEDLSDGQVGAFLRGAAAMLD